MDTRLTAAAYIKGAAISLVGLAVLVGMVEEVVSSAAGCWMAFKLVWHTYSAGKR